MQWRVYRRPGVVLVALFMACCALLSITSTILYSGRRKDVRPIYKSTKNIELILAAETLQNDGFNCSNSDDWRHMRSLIIHKLSFVNTVPDVAYMKCVASNHKQCAKERQNIEMINRKCHFFSQMRFLKKEENTYKLYALASSPGAGNRWVRFILEELTGVFTGSKYCDSKQLFSGFFGESMLSNHVLAIETYGMNDSLSQYDSVIYVIRNPYHTILSQLTKKYAKMDSALAVIEDKDFQTGLMKWASSVESWLMHSSKPVHVVSYDQLLATTEAELLRLVHFLDFPISTRTVACIVNSSSNSYKYDRFGPRNPFSEEQRKQVQEVILKYERVWHKHKVSYHWTWDT